MTTCDILIVDCIDDECDMVPEVFTHCGIANVGYVYSALQAFTYLQQIQNVEDLPKLIVTELYLPDISGIEFSANLKAIQKYQEIPVIVVYSNKNDKQKYLKREYICG